MAYFGNKQKRTFRRRTRRNVFRRNSEYSLNSEAGKNIFIGILIFTFFSLILLGAFKVFSSDYFRVYAITPYGERTVGKEELTKSLEVFYGRLVFFLNKDDIQFELKKKYPGMEVSRFRKFWPNKIQLIVTETEPLIFYTNLGGAYLINENGLVTEVIIQEKVNFEEKQLNLITGAEGINSELVRDRLHSQFEEDKDPDSEEKFSFAKVSNEKKLETLNTIRDELVVQSKALMVSYEELYDKDSFPDLEKVYSFENKVYSVGEGVDENKLHLTREVVKFFNQFDKEELKELYWEGKFLIKVETESGKLITFGTNRSVSEQLEDYIIVMEELKKEGNNYSTIDLTSAKISVK